MNKLFFPLIILATLILSAGCSEKFNVAAPAKDITVIYGFLDRADTAHYIRVQKAFLDQDKSALVMAKDPDNSFYKNINVRINMISRTDTGHVFDTIHLDRVDLGAEGYPKDSGVFFEAPNYAYKFKNVLNPDYFYRIIVTNLTTGQVDSADAAVIDDVTPGTYIVDMIDDSSTNKAGLDFAILSNSQYVEVNISYLAPGDFNFFGQTSPVYLAYPIFRFNWVDSSITTGAKSSHSFDMSLGNNVMTTNAIKIDTKNAIFYSAVESGMGIAPANTVRLMDRCDVITYVASQEYYFYQRSGLTQGVGLTGSEIEPIYTNIKGANTPLGLYTSRGSQAGKITITPGTITALIDSPQFSAMHVIGTVYK